MADNFQVTNNKMSCAVGGALAGGAIGAAAGYMCRENLRNSNNFLTTWADSLVLYSDKECKDIFKKYNVLEEEIKVLKNKEAVDNFLSSKKIGNLPEEVLKSIKNGNLENAKVNLELCLHVDKHYEVRNILKQIPQKRFNKAYMILFGTIGALVATPLAVLLCNKNKKNSFK
jgi:hypothetical protein